MVKVNGSFFLFGNTFNLFHVTFHNNFKVRIIGLNWYILPYSNKGGKVIISKTLLQPQSSSGWVIPKKILDTFFPGLHIAYHDSGLAKNELLANFKTDNINHLVAINDIGENYYRVLAFSSGPYSPSSEHKS